MGTMNVPLRIGQLGERAGISFDTLSHGVNR